MVRCIYIDENKKWWLAEPINGDPISDDIRIIEEFNEEYKKAWTDEFIQFINSCVPHILFFDSKGNTCGTPFESRNIVV